MPKVQYTIRMEEHLFDKVKIISEKQVRSLNNQFEFFIAKAVEKYEKENGEIIPKEER